MQLGNLFKPKASALIQDISKHEIFLHSGSLAYTTGLALAPFVIVMLSLAGRVSPETQQEIIGQLTSSLGRDVGAAFQMIIESIRKSNSSGNFPSSIGLCVLIFSASAIFSQLRMALDKVDGWEPPPKASGLWIYLEDKVFSIGLVLGFAILSITFLVISTVPIVFFPQRSGHLWKLFSFVFNLFIFTGLFASLFRFIPSLKLPWRRCLFSGLCATIFFLIGNFLIGIYLAHTAGGSIYGAAGSLIVFLVWVYYIAFTFLLSYEVTKSRFGH